MLHLFALGVVSYPDLLHLMILVVFKEVLVDDFDTFQGRLSRLPAVHANQGDVVFEALVPRESRLILVQLQSEVPALAFLVTFLVLLGLVSLFLENHTTQPFNSFQYLGGT